MPRDGSGNYTLPLPMVVSGNVVESVWANTTLADIALALTDSLSRTGAGGLLTPFTIADGTVGAPGLAFANEPTSGMYRAGLNDYRLAVAGQSALELTASGITSRKPLTSTGDLRVSNGVTGLGYFGPGNNTIYGSDTFMQIGTLDAKPLNFITNSVNRLVIAADGSITANSPLTTLNTLSAFGGVASSVGTPAVGLMNNRMISWRDNADGYTNAGFVWYDASNFIHFGVGNLSRVHIGSGGMGVDVPIVLYSGQISFPATQVASTGPNTLDDYEEGSFTPILNFGGSAGAAAYITQVGKYTKIGNCVAFAIIVAISAKTAATGAATITGLPFAAGEYTGCAGRIGSVVVPGGGQAYAIVNGAGTHLILQGVTTAGGIVTIDDTHVSTSANLIISGTYRAI